MAGKVNKIINVKVEGVGKIKQLEESLKKLRKQQRDIKKDMKEGANAGKYAEQQYKKSEQAIKNQSKALRETKKAMVDANNTTRKGTTLQNSMAMGVLKGAAAFSILVTAFRRVSQAMVTMIGTFTEFEFTMAKVKAVSGATEDEFKRLSDSAQELGRSTFFTASEVANLQLNLSKLGFTVTEIEAATEATINLSIATGSDLARSATVAGNAIRGFQLDASETGRVVDVMAVAFTSSALDIEKWQTSMTKVAPIAAMAGFSIEETTAIMSKLSDTGIEASIAGTSLRNIFLKMQDPTSELTKKVGHTVHSLDGMLEMFKSMQEEGTDLGDVLTFMDVRQVAAFGTMLKGSDDIAKLRDELMNASGAGQEMADTIGDTLQGSIFKVKSALQGISIALTKQFGGALQKTLEKLAKWANDLVDNEDKIKKFWTQIKFATKIIGYFVLGLIPARIALTAIAAKTTLVGFGMKAMAGATAIATAAWRTFTLVLASSGIGLAVVILGELAAALMFASDETEKLASREDLVSQAMVKTYTDIERVNKSLKSLKKTREDINKINDEGAVSQEKIRRLRNQEKIDIDTINGFLKTHNKELVKQKDNIDDIETSTRSLITAMTDKALATVFTDMQAVILKTKVTSDIIENKIKQNLTANSTLFQVDSDVSSIIKDVEDEFGTAWYDVNFTAGDKYRVRRAERLKKMLDDYGMTISEFKESIKGGYYKNEIKSLETAVSALTKTSLSDLLTPVTEEEEDEIIPQKYKYKLEELVSKYQADVDLTLGKLESDVKMLEAKRNALQQFLGQKGVKGTDNNDEVKAKLQLSKTLVAIDKAYYDKKASEIEQDRQNKKNAANIDVLEGTAQAEDLYSVLNTIDEQQNAKLLKSADSHNQELFKIEDKIAKQSIKNKKDNFKESERIATEAHTKEKLDLDLSLANEEITSIEHKARMLSLEAEFLGNMAKLYEQYGQSHVDIDNKITQNTIDTKEQQEAALREYISALGDLGGFMQDVAGEEDKMNAVRKAGIIITEAAATAEKIMGIMTTLSTLATAADIALTPAKVATDGAKTGSTMALAGATFLKSIADGIRGLPVWAQIIGIAAIVASIGAAKRNISSAFKSPTGGGGDDPSPSGGGGSGGGQMSLMTFGGQHTTAGAIDGYAQGGMVHGNSHAQGGEKFSVGGRVVELEGGEAVINKRSTSMFRSQLSAMNYAGGGVSFADGGVTNVPSFAQTQFQVDGQRGIQGAMNQRSKVVVVEADITKSQNRVSAIEAEASF